MNKFDVRRIVKDHYATLYDNRVEDRSHRLDNLAMVVVPTLFAILLIVLGVRLHELGQLLAAVSVLAGFLFALLIVLLETAVETSGRAEEHGATSRTHRRIQVLREVTANVAYSVLVAVLAVVVIGAAQIAVAPATDDVERSGMPAWFSIVVFAVLMHLVLTLVMVIKRVYAVATRELDYASVPDDAGGALPRRP